MDPVYHFSVAASVVAKNVYFGMFYVLLEGLEKKRKRERYTLLCNHGCFVSLLLVNEVLTTHLRSDDKVINAAPHVKE